MPRLTPHIKKRIPLIILLIPLVALCLVLVVPKVTHATLLDAIKSNLDLTGGATELPGGEPGSLQTTAGKIIKAVLTLVGTIFLVLMVYAGFKWMLARGRTEEVESAQKIIESSIIGLIVVVLAYAISTFVFSVIMSST